jgi:hypothetical protein
VDGYIDGASKVSLANFRCTIFIKKDSWYVYSLLVLYQTPEWKRNRK